MVVEPIEFALDGVPLAIESDQSPVERADSLEPRRLLDRVWHGVSPVGLEEK